MTRFAAIDVGSNASRLLIVQATNSERTRTVTSLRMPVRLGHSVFQTGMLDPETLDASVAAMRRFSEEIGKAEVVYTRAVVTASGRGASNLDVLLRRVREEAGITLEPIDGTEEARLVSLAVRHNLEISGRGLLMDLGGGSLELTEVEGDRRGFAVSLPIGTVRLLEAFLKGGEPVDRRQDRLVREYVDRMLIPHRRKLRRRAWDVAIGTGGNFVAIANLCPSPGWDFAAIDVEAARALLGEMAAMSAQERAEEYGLRPDRADVIVPALYVVVAMADLARVSEIVAPDVGVKEGIITELTEKHYRVWDWTAERDKVYQAALELGRRYHFDEHHGTQVSLLARQIFDGMKSIHGLDKGDRNLLGVAGLLHDIGDYVNASSHHKHSQYLIDNSDLMGVGPEDRKIIGIIARYHRRADPSPRHAPFKSLSSTDQERVRKMAAIVRVADALDRGHRGRVQSIGVKVKKSTALIQLASRGDTALEEWTLDRKSELFRRVFGLDVRLQTLPKD